MSHAIGKFSSLRGCTIHILSLITLAVISSGCSVATTSLRVRDVTSLSPQELQTIRREGNDVILLDQEPPPIQGRLIKMYGKDARGVYQVFFLSTCTGKLYNSLGATVYQYPGEWGDTDCMP